jgi:hypothetical protein
MKPVFKIALALSVFAGSLTAQAQTSNAPMTSSAQMTSSAPKPGPKITKKSQLHDGCHSRAAQMAGKPCH